MKIGRARPGVGGGATCRQRGRVSPTINSIWRVAVSVSVLVSVSLWCACDCVYVVCGV